MGFDIQGFISKVEKFVNDNKADRQGKTGDGQFDTYEKASLFNNRELLNELKVACEADESVQEQVQSDLGISLSYVKTRVEELAETNNARRAPGAGDGDDGDGRPVVNITVEAGGVANIIIDNSSNWQLTINITADLKNMVKELIEAFKTGFESINENNNQLFEELKKYLTDQNELTSHIFSFLYTLYDAIRMDSDLQIDALMAILNAINENGANIGFKIDQTNELLKALNEMLMDKLDNIAIMISKADANAQENMAVLINLVKQNNEDQSKQNEILSNILNAIKSLNGTIKTFSAEQKEQLAAILNLLQAQGDDLDANFQKVLAMLEAIRLAEGDNNTELKKIYDAIIEGNTQLLDALVLINQNFSQYGDDIKALLLKIAEKETSGGTDLKPLMEILQQVVDKLTSIDQNTGDTANYTKQILDAVNKLGVNISGSLNAILEAIGNDTTKLDAIVALLNKLDEHNTEQNQAILDAIANFGLDLTASFDKLIEIGNTQIDLQEKTNMLIDQVIYAINNLKLECPNVVVDVSAIIDAINQNGSDISAKLDNLNAIMEIINKNIVEGNENNKEIGGKILAAISKLGLDITDALKNIVVNLDPSALDSLASLIEKFNKDNSEENKAILDAIAGLGNGMADILKALQELEVNVSVTGGQGGPTDLTEVIQAIYSVGADLRSKLTDIFSLMTTLNANVIEIGVDNKQFAQLILNAIANVGNIPSGDGTHNFDLSEIITLLQQILAAIKDHDVNVTIVINDNGEVHCYTDEGENNDWSNVLSARAVNPQEQTGIDSAKTEKQDKTQVYDLLGRPVRGPLKPGQVYTQNGKKFIAR